MNKKNYLLEMIEQEEKIFLSNDISNVQKEQLLHSIWIKKLKLLKEFLNNYKVINDIVSSNQFIFRDDAIETINYLQRKYQVLHLGLLISHQTLHQ